MVKAYLMDTANDPNTTDKFDADFIKKFGNWQKDSPVYAQKCTGK